MPAAKTRGCKQVIGLARRRVADGADHPRPTAPVADIRPLVRLNVTIVVEDGDRMETASAPAGGSTMTTYFDPRIGRRRSTRRCARRWSISSSVPAPAGEMTVVLGPGWPGVMLHEAVGHGLEGDFNRKKTSAFAGLMGQRVASPGVTVVDDGTIADRRGSLTIDDEGTPTALHRADRGRHPQRLYAGPT